LFFVTVKYINILKIDCIGGVAGVQRSAFHGVLTKHLPETCRIHLSKRLKSYSQTNPSGNYSDSEKTAAVQLQFEDGTTASCDILVGADGIKSPVRRCLLKEKADALRLQGKVEEADELMKSVEPTWTGAVTYRMTIPLDRLRTELPAGHPILRNPSQVCVISYS
jgi:salicylate hydroxylase